MMKNNIWILLICVMGLQACDDALTMIPENATTYENGLNSIHELDNALNGLFLYGRDYALWNISTPNIRGIQADIVTDQVTLKKRRLQHETAPWQQDPMSYQMVHQANLILKALDDVEMSDERYNMYKGNALFYKAYAYFEMTRRYGDVVIIKEELVYDSISRSSMAKVYDYIIELLIEAEKLVPEFSDYERILNITPIKCVACKGSVNALLANACVWQAGTKWFAYEEDKNTIDETNLLNIAEEACTKVINSSDYKLAGSIAEVCTKVLRGNSDESVFEFPYRNLSTEMREINGVNMAAMYWVSWPVREDQYEFHIEYNMLKLLASNIKNTYEIVDDRRKEYFYKLDNPTPSMISTYAYPYKYRDVSYQTYKGTSYKAYKNLNTDRIIIRLNEIYLLRAEIRAKLGKNELAIEDLNKIRARANASLYQSTEYNGDIRMAVFKEMDKELIFEDYRYYQIIRNGEPYVREFLEGKFKTAPLQDFIDGAFWVMYTDDAVYNNSAWRKNVYWSKNK